MKYLIRFQPLEPYTFVEDQDSYKIFSSDLPSQSTILGTLRYLVLKNTGLLKTSYRYSKSDKEKMAELIGPESFSFGSVDEFQGYGVISKISPVFLLDSENRILVRNPFCNLSEDGYLPLRLGKRVKTSWGEMAIPEVGQGLGRTGHGEGYLRLPDMRVIHTEEIFLSSYDMAAAYSEEKNQKENYFKREKRILKTGYSFAILADFEENSEFQYMKAQEICFMGKKSAAFSVNAVAFDTVREEIFSGEVSLEEYLESVFKEYIEKSLGKIGITRKLMGQLRQTWYYAVSDIYVGEAKTFTSYVMTDVKREKLLASGSVFNQKPEIPQDKYLITAGYNAVIQIGG